MTLFQSFTAGKWFMTFGLILYFRAGFELLEM